MTADPLSGLVKALRSKTGDPKDPTRIAVVTDIAQPSGGAQVRFEGEASAGSRWYRMLCAPRVGDRVVMLRVGSTWVVSGVIRPGFNIQARNSTVTTNGSGVGTVTFTEPFSAAPIVTANSRSGFTYVDTVVPTSTGFTFVARNSVGTLITSTSVTIAWIATIDTG